MRKYPGIRISSLGHLSTMKVVLEDGLVVNIVSVSSPFGVESLYVQPFHVTSCCCAVTKGVFRSDYDSLRQDECRLVASSVSVLDENSEPFVNVTESHDMLPFSGNNCCCCATTRFVYLANSAGLRQQEFRLVASTQSVLGGSSEHFRQCFTKPRLWLFSGRALHR